MRSLLVFIVVFSSLPMILVRPYYGVLMYSWLSYMNPHRITWGAAYNFPFAMIVGATTIVAWLISREPKRIPICGATVLLVAFTLWLNVTTLFALVPDEAWRKWDTVMKIMFMTFLTLALATDRKRIHALVWVIVVSIGFFGIRGGVFMILTGGNYLTYGPPDSFIESNNDLALALIMILPLMRYLQMHTKSRWVQLGLLGAVLLSMLAIISSYSRGAVLALSIMLLYMWAKSRRRFVIAVFASVALAVGLSFMPQKWIDRVQSIENYENDASAQGRFDAWLFAINLAKDRPILGGGFNAQEDSDLFMRYSPDAAGARAIHSIYFEVLAEHGFVGLSLYLALMASVFRMAASIKKMTKGNDELIWARDLATMLQVGFVGYATGGMFLSRAYFDLYYTLVALMILTFTIIRKEVAASAKEAQLQPAAVGQAFLKSAGQG